MQMFLNHEIKYIKQKTMANFLRVPGRGGEFIVNSGFLPSRMKRKENPPDAGVITLRNRAWEGDGKIPNYLCEPKKMDAPEISENAFWTYWEHNISSL